MTPLLRSLVAVALVVCTTHAHAAEKADAGTSTASDFDAELDAITREEKEWMAKEQARREAREAARRAERERKRRTEPRFELNFGFLSGIREGAWGFVVNKASAGVPGAAALSSPFAAAPFDDLLIAGPAWEVRWVHHNVRMTAGLVKPFPTFATGAGAGTVDVEGTAHTFSARSLSLWDLRLGLGFELPFFSRVTPFADLVGNVQLAEADVTLDGAPVKYASTSFGYSARAGLRMQFGDSLTLAVAFEYAITGTPLGSYDFQVLAGYSFGD